jgi:uncharacterized membrane protein YqhA
MLKPIEALFERILWSSRLIVLVAVVASLVVSLVMFYVASVDAIQLVNHALHYYSEAMHDLAAKAELRTLIVAHVVEIVDGYLLAAIMLIFSLGLYELFISRIDIAEKSDLASRVLLIRSLDDLKDRLAKVILLVLVVKFFEYALQLQIEGAVDLLCLAGGIVLVSAALYLSHGKPAGSSKH